MAVSGVLFCPHAPILVSEVGKGREEEARATLDGFAAQDALAGRWEFDSVLVFSPHAPMFSDAACVLAYEKYEGGLAEFGVKEGPAWRQDAGLARALAKALAGILPTLVMDEATARRYRKATAMDHGAAVPLTLLNAARGKPVVVIAPGLLPVRALYEAGKALAKAVEEAGKRVLVVASGDLAHCHGGGYPFKPEGAEYDALVRGALERGDAAGLLNIDPSLTEAAMQCAFPSFAMALGMLDGRAARFSVHSCEAPFGVGYICATAEVLGDGPQLEWRERDPYVELARAALEIFIKTGRVPAWEELRPRFCADFIEEAEGKRAGAFVSLHKDGDLRGCIGTISATQPSLAMELIYCACEAAGSDPRFTPVEPHELLLLDVKADVLTEAEPISSIDQLDPKRYGVIVRSGMRRGLLLPDLDGVDSALRQVAIAREKAGISAGENVELQRFQVNRHTSSSFFHSFGVR